MSELVRVEDRSEGGLECLSGASMKRAFPSLTGKHQLLLLGDGWWCKGGDDRWYLIGKEE